MFHHVTHGSRYCSVIYMLVVHMGSELWLCSHLWREYQDQVRLFRMLLVWLVAIRMVQSHS